MIYYGRLMNDNIKIGYTTNLLARVGPLAVNRRTGELSCILGVHDGDFEDEQSMHRRFAHLRIKADGCPEDFRPADDLIDHILGECQPCSEVDEANRVISLQWLRSKTASTWRRSIADGTGRLVRCKPMAESLRPPMEIPVVWKD
jgi:hypothetical protein